jgi:hypothetical protein
LSAGDAVVNVYINQEKRFAFVEMRTVEEASNAMALDGIIYEVWIWKKIIRVVVEFVNIQRALLMVELLLSLQNGPF